MHSSESLPIATALDSNNMQYFPVAHYAAQSFTHTPSSSGPARPEHPSHLVGKVENALAHVETLLGAVRSQGCPVASFRALRLLTATLEAQAACQVGVWEFAARESWRAAHC